MFLMPFPFVVFSRHRKAAASWGTFSVLLLPRCRRPGNQLEAFLERRVRPGLGLHTNARRAAQKCRCVVSNTHVYLFQQDPARPGDRRLCFQRDFSC